MPHISRLQRSYKAVLPIGVTSYRQRGADVWAWRVEVTASRWGGGLLAHCGPGLSETLSPR
jgi:hypothetical protein